MFRQLLVYLILAASLPATALAADLEAGEKLYATCAECHGPNAEGMAEFNSPALAGQSESYLIRQLWDFKKGNRGAADDDTIGAQMRPKSMALPADGEAIANVAAYLATLPPSKPPATVEGDVANGQKLYNSRCGACHGGKGWGSEALHTPRLNSIGDSYLIRQVRNFQNGSRGTHKDARQGKQMAMMAKAVAADELQDIAAYLNEPELHAGDHKSILITGASTGIGRNLAETLAQKGYHVYAGARKDKDLAALNAIDNVTAVKLDVTKQDQVDAVVAMIREKGTGLYALVNNAGVGGGGTVVDTPIENQTFIYTVNVEGVYRTTQAFAPLVIESKGRIVTTGSIAGTVSAFPGFSAYSGSKHWIEAYTDSLATEMEPHGVVVSVVEPGNYKSNIRRSSVARGFEKAKAAGGEVTEEMNKTYEATAERELSYKEPDEVSEAFIHALFDAKPLRRYVVVPNAEEQEFTIRTKVNELVQLNQWGPYRYSRDELVKLLDAALSGDAPAE